MNSHPRIRTLITLAVLALSAGGARAALDSITVAAAPNRDVESPATNLDGSVLAYTRKSRVGTQSDIWLLDLKASTQALVRTRLNTSASTTQLYRLPSLDDAGRYVAWASLASSRWSIQRLDRSTGSLASMALLPTGATPTSVRLSPDGSRAAVSYAPSSGNPILTIYGGTGTPPTTQRKLLALAPSGRVWMPDGSAVVFSAQLTSRTNSIFRLNATTGATTNVTCGSSDSLATLTATTPAEVFFLRVLSLSGTPRVIYRAPATTACGAVVQVANLGNVTVSGMAVTGNGSAVMMSANPGADLDIYRVDAATGALTNLTTRSFAATPVAPSPDYDGDIVYFDDKASGSTGKKFLTVVNGRVPDAPVVGSDVYPPPPFEVGDLRCSTLDDPNFSQLDCGGLVRGATGATRPVLMFQDLRTSNGTVRDRGPFVVPLVANQERSFTARWLVTCPSGGQSGTYDTRAVAVQSDVPQDDVYFAVNSGSYCN